MNNFALIFSTILSITFLTASLPVVAAHYNHHQQDNAWDSYYSDHYYPQHESASYYPANNYYVVNQQYNVFQPQPAQGSNDSYEQQRGLPYTPHVPSHLNSYPIPAPSSLAQNHYPPYRPHQQQDNTQHRHAENPPVSDKGSPYDKKGSYVYNFYVKPKEPVQAKKHICPVEGCTKSYSRPSDLKCHLQIKHPEYAQEHNLYSGAYPCPQQNCHARFTRRKILAKHMIKHHSVAETPNINTTGTPSQNVVEGFEPPEPLMNSQEGNENDHGGQRQAQDHQADKKYSLSFICGE